MNVGRRPNPMYGLQFVYIDLFYPLYKKGVFGGTTFCNNLSPAVCGHFDRFAHTFRSSHQFHFTCPKKVFKKIFFGIFFLQSRRSNQIHQNSIKKS